MLRYLYGHQLDAHQALTDSMFLDRARQFHDRLGWDVHLAENGHERDQYDTLDPLYVIWELPDGQHGGSLRLLPTTGRTMVNDHFGHILPDGYLHAPDIWECTRFCLGSKADPRIAAALMLGGGEVMRRFDLTQFVGVFDARMVRIYRMIGASPNVLGSLGTGRDQISVGLWAYDPADRQKVLDRAGLTSAQSETWIADALGPIPTENDRAA